MTQTNDVWKIETDDFSKNGFSKYESIMTQGNGYLGIRASHEENYHENTRGFFLSGIFNKADATEVSELPNIADILAFEMTINEAVFDLFSGEILHYHRSLDLRNGELVRHIIWQNTSNDKFSIIYSRFVSLEDIHLVISKVEITPLTSPALIKIKTGIDGRMTNSGTQHFSEIEKRVYSNAVMQYCQRTNETQIDVIVNSLLEINATQSFSTDRRRIYTESHSRVCKDETLSVVKKSCVVTSRDRVFIESYDYETAKAMALNKINGYKDFDYIQLLNKSQAIWQQYYEQNGIEIKGSNYFDQLAINFALYHLKIMNPEDERYSIGAKGLSGEGYKGHVFWDTEIFLLPFFLYSDPKAANKLLAYRFNNLNAAKQNAIKNGYRGALFPWESGYSGEEETPEFAAMNIKSGTRERIWSAKKEHHIVADVGYSVIQYFEATNDTDFMINRGLEMLYACSEFWVSRSTLVNNRIEILDCIGPDEYTEHIDNNAYTNYMAWYVVKNTIEWHKKFNKAVDLETFELFVSKIYLPRTNKNLILPQDDTFLSKDTIEISKYKHSEMKQSILKDYTRDEVVNLQVLKQADVVMLMYLLPEIFTEAEKKANFNYYEKRTIHDSSLSMCIHSILAARVHEITLAYECFEKGCRIDLGDNIKSSPDGIHAAALGALWKAVIFGFGGVDVRGSILAINPILPSAWQNLRFPFVWQGHKMWIEIDDHSVKIESITNQTIEVSISNRIYRLKGKSILKLDYTT